MAKWQPENTTYYLESASGLFVAFYPVAVALPDVRTPSIQAVPL
jgi:hypothetical protein